MLYPTVTEVARHGKATAQAPPVQTPTTRYPKGAPKWYPCPKVVTD